MTTDDELRAFKQVLELPHIAASLFGYAIDEKKTRRGGGLFMRRPDGDKIIINQGRAGWIYWSPNGHQGTVIDLYNHHEGGTLGDVRRGLRPFLGKPAPSPKSYIHRVREPIEKDFAAVAARYDAMERDPLPPYLIERGIPREILEHPCLQDTWRVDQHGNIAFPHRTPDGNICGYEVLGRDYKSFASKGSKALWTSRTRGDDRILVFAESPLDATSYIAIHGTLSTRVASIGGALNKNQPMVIRKAIQAMPPGSQIRAATDNDAAGRDLAAVIEQQAGGYAFRYTPPTAANVKDWNDALRIRTRWMARSRGRDSGPELER